MNILTAARAALVARLSEITPANGYLTEGGTRVKTGWVNEVLEEHKEGFPLIVVQPAKGQPPKAGPGSVILGKGFSVVGAVDVGLDYESALDDMEIDLIRCLMPGHQRFPKWLPVGVNNIQLGTPEPFPPGNGTAVGTVLIPVYLSTVIEGI